MKNKTVRLMVGNAIFIAVCVVLTLISNYIPIGGLTINLALIAIATAAIIYGPISGLIVGLANGGLVMLTAAPFFAISPFGTVLTCLLKSGLAGLVCGLVYKMLSKKNRVMASIIATILVPIVNTGLFFVFALLFFRELFGSAAGIISALVTINFAIEFTVCLMLAPSIAYVYTVINRRGYAS